MDYHFEVSENCMFNKIRQVSRYVTNIYSKSLKEVGLTPIQHSMMTAIKKLKNANINTLSEAIKMDRTTINRNLKPLIREGIVYIGKEKDKREKHVLLTVKGEEIYANAYDKWKKAQDEFEVKIGKKNWLEMNKVINNISKII